MPKIKILVVPSDRHGVGKYRSIDPHIYLQNHHKEDFHVDIDHEPPVDNDDYYKQYQIIHFHTMLHKGGGIAAAYELTQKRLTWCRAQGIKTIVDIDDYWMPDQFHPMYHIIKERKDNEYKVKVMRLVDYITTTTPIFADEIRKRTGLSNVVVLPNAIDPNEPQFQSKPEASERVRFGWLGGSSHQFDLEGAKEGLASALNNYNDEIQLVLCGFDLRGTMTEINKETGQIEKRDIRPEETSWYQYERFFTDEYRAVDKGYKDFLHTFKKDEYPNVVNMPYRRVWTQSISSYAENYNKMDVSLAPLKDTLFNSCKSQLKVIEAGFHKKPLIASNFGPYTLDLVSAVQKGGGVDPKGNALLVDTNKAHKQWFQHITRMLKSASLREDLGGKLHETVKEKYSLAVVTQTRSDFYKSIV